jgi:hypothetical protein
MYRSPKPFKRIISQAQPVMIMTLAVLNQNCRAKSEDREELVGEIRCCLANQASIQIADGKFIVSFTSGHQEA